MKNKPPMTGNGKVIPPARMVMTGGWFMTLFQPALPCLHWWNFMDETHDPTYENKSAHTLMIQDEWDFWRLKCAIEVAVGSFWDSYPNPNHSWRRTVAT